MLASCWHNIPAHYAFYYASIFDAGLCMELAIVIRDFILSLVLLMQVRIYNYSNAKFLWWETLSD